MKVLKSISVIIIAILLMQCGSSKKLSKPAKSQLKYFPAELQEYGLYFGMPKSELHAKFSEGKFNSEDFRETVLVEGFDGRVKAVGLYLDAENDKPFYEIIIIPKDDASGQKMAEAMFGQANYMNKEWRFSKEKTGFDFDIGAWVFKNKLIVATTLKGSEWEPGFTDPK
ncbi:MAG: hypothetical protein MRY83_06505 [Flavobacteriales bacterium]|nr:hypothetical protein [Flavobacteriales bacterium]